MTASNQLHHEVGLLVVGNHCIHFTLLREILGGAGTFQFQVEATLLYPIVWCPDHHWFVHRWLVDLQVKVDALPILVKLHIFGLEVRFHIILGNGLHLVDYKCSQHPRRRTAAMAIGWMKGLHGSNNISGRTGKQDDSVVDENGQHGLVAQYLLRSTLD